MSKDVPEVLYVSPDPGSLGRFRSKYLTVVWIIFAVIWAIACVRPASQVNWWTENALTLIFVAILLVTRKRFPLSVVSHTLIVVYLSLHTIGAHYSYSNVPYNDWWRGVFGRPLHTGRNHYDRLIHFLFGVLLAYPIREVFLRVAGVRGFWGYYLPLDVTMSFSMVYELIEWGYAATFGGDAGQSFLGTQGDEWDAHKDMALASLGALISMSVVAFINWRFDKNFGDEFRRSLGVREGDKPLGEVRLAELRDRSARK
jgi:putative membrane protein